MKRLGILYLYTKPFRPQTNGKVEVFWKIIKREFLTNISLKIREKSILNSISASITTTTKEDAAR